jgi:hypothetical protein
MKRVCKDDPQGTVKKTISEHCLKFGSRFAWDVRRVMPCDLIEKPENKVNGWLLDG